MDIDGEHLGVDVRIVVSPVGGVFTAEPALSAMVEVGTTLGHVRSGCDLVAVRTPFRGALQLAAH